MENGIVLLRIFWVLGFAVGSLADDAPAENPLMILSDRSQVNFIEGRLYLPDEKEPFTGEIGWDEITADVDDSIVAVVNYVDGLQHGLVSIYQTHACKRLLYQHTYERGLKSGPSLSFEKDGKISSVSHFRNGVEEGRSIRLHPNGRTSSLWTYRSGIDHGPCEVYDVIGNLKWKGNYFLGFKDGEFLIHDVEKQVTEITTYNGKKIAEDLLKYLGWSQKEYFEVARWRMISNLDHIPKENEKGLNAKLEKWLSVVGDYFEREDSEISHREVPISSAPAKPL